ncbi:ABC transporter ATP-binding protein [Asticcacaulis taihuensis]|uniref:ABC transporter ATP-binding protein n=1 Tax=Asticcacaulis taihuensis TaxID=260084 RepID=UPI0026F3537F|nr:ABC transporter ATP-binding protein [Asticcacaulis taihuensis]
MSRPDAIISLVDVVKTYGGFMALKKLTLQIGHGEFFTLLGPSGSGKTTTLRLISGFERPDGGRIEINGENVADQPPYERNVNTVFQDYALFPHMSLFENVAYGLRTQKLPATEIKTRTMEALDMVRLADFMARKPAQLSGGQRQRIALARAVVNRPAVLLLDEPLGALDLKLRHEMQIELKKIHRDLGITFVYVTHDQEEALTMSDRIAVFDQGEIAQIGTPADVYERPVNPYVAKFVGLSNLLMRDGRTLMVRPEKLRLYDMSPESQSMETLAGEVVDIVYVGLMTRYLIRTQEGDDITALELNARASQSQPRFTRGQPVWVGYSPDSVHVL